MGNPCRAGPRPLVAQMPSRCCWLWPPDSSFTLLPICAPWNSVSIRKISCCSVWTRSRRGIGTSLLAAFYSGLLDGSGQFLACKTPRCRRCTGVPLLERRGCEHPGTLLLQVERRPSTCLMTVDAAFSTMQIPVLVGRGMDSRDMQSTSNRHRERAIRPALFPEPESCGQADRSWRRENPCRCGNRGVARHRYNDLRNDNPPVVYVPYTQDLRTLGAHVEFEVRTAGNPVALSNTIRQIVSSCKRCCPGA